MFSRMGSAAFKKDLHNIRMLCHHLGDPQDQFRTIHVGGTNGKGSVCHLLSAILQEAGYKTGLHTSPHLYDFRERIRLNGQMVEKEFVVDFVEKTRALAEEIKPSFFELTVAMSFDYFAQCRVDVAVIEVGLGGRLDSTNIINPAISVITNIGWDHMNLLGDSLSGIAREKAGIIKAGIPVVIGEKHEATEEIFRAIAAEKNAPIYFAEECFSLEKYQLSQAGIHADYVDLADHKIISIASDLAGIYQLKNLATVLQTVEVLKEKKFRITLRDTEEGIRQAKKLTGLHGRWEVLHLNPGVVLEVAHNQDGMLKMMEHVRELEFNRLHIVLGMVKDKDIHQVLGILPPEASYYFTQAKIPRALEAGKLREYALEHGLRGNRYGDVMEALEAALADASPSDLVIVCGSIFLVAEVDRSSITQLS